MPKTIKRKKKDTPEKDRHFGVILEDINSKFSVLVEGHSALNAKIDKNHQEFREFREETNSKFKILGNSISEVKKDVKVLKEDVGVLKEDVKVLKKDVSVLKQDVVVLKQDVKVLKQDVSVLKQDVKVLKEDVGVLKEDMTIVKSKLTSIENQQKQKVDVNQFEGLEQRVARLEKKAR